MKKSTFFIVGKHAVTEALKNPNRKCLKIYLTEESKKNLNRENQKINILRNIQVIFRSKKELDNLSGNSETSHQGLVLEIEKKEDISVKEFLNKNNTQNINLIVLDGVTDPRNIGSIIRTALAFNIDGIIVKERSFPEKSKLMYKSASGGVEHLNIFKVSNINSTLKYLKSKNFWVSAFDVRGKKDFKENNWEGRNVLLFGSEGEGLRQKTLGYSDHKFKISINPKIESLNISNTVSVVCHYIQSQLHSKN